MWKDYSSGYLKNNRACGLSIALSAFLSALLLSLLCSLFYNMWKYEVERIRLEEGGWQSRIEGEFQQDEIEAVKNYGNVKDVQVNTALSQDEKVVIDLYFDKMGTVLTDTARIAERLGASPEAVTYHHSILAMYLVRDPQDTAPRLTFPFFLLVMALAAVSLIVIIHNAFAVSMNDRVRQFGIFSSVGATPRQIRSCLLQEAAALCAVPVVAGDLLGIAGSYGLLEMTNLLLKDSGTGRHEAAFGYHPLVFGAALLVIVLTIWISAWLPARRLSRVTPLKAMKQTGELQLRRKRRSPILALIFGIEGELAGNALKAQRKSLRMASFSLVLAFLAFTLMQCFFTLSGISTRETYFERYQNAWDLMVTVKNTQVTSFGETEDIRELSGVENVLVYQNAVAKRIITEEEMSDELKNNGGFSHVSGNEVTRRPEGWLVSVPLIIMDDASFLDYCEQIGITPSLDGAVIRNQIRDVTNPDFRHPQYMPYIKEETETSALSQSDDGSEMVEIPILACTEEVPNLREEYATVDYYELVHFLPVSLWEQIQDRIGGEEADTYIRILGEKPVTLEKLNNLQGELEELLETRYTIETENRIQEYETNEIQIRGMKMILGGLCVLLAIIGVGNVFSNTLGFVRQRSREFARYLSVGLTPAKMRKMFCIEGLVVAGRPMLVTLPLAVIAIWGMLRMSYLEAEVFLAEAPFVPIAIFMAAIFGTVALAYYLGWRRVRNIDLARTLRDDTMM